MERKQCPICRNDINKFFKYNYNGKLLGYWDGRNEEIKIFYCFLCSNFIEKNNTSITIICYKCNYSRVENMVFYCNICTKYFSKFEKNYVAHSLKCKSYKCTECECCFLSKKIFLLHKNNNIKTNKIKALIQMYEKKNEGSNKSKFLDLFNNFNINN